MKIIAWFSSYNLLRNIRVRCLLVSRFQKENIFRKKKKRTKNFEIYNRYNYFSGEIFENSSGLNLVADEAKFNPNEAIVLKMVRERKMIENDGC